jgi:predicted O-linked N-acetylglucosamine transferase (SPINDLY family)
LKKDAQKTLKETQTPLSFHSVTFNNINQNSSNLKQSNFLQNDYTFDNDPTSLSSISAFPFAMESKSHSKTTNKKPSERDKKNELNQNQSIQQNSETNGKQQDLDKFETSLHIPFENATSIKVQSNIDPSFKNYSSLPPRY